MTMCCNFTRGIIKKVEKVYKNEVNANTENPTKKNQCD